MNNSFPVMEPFYITHKWKSLFSCHKARFDNFVNRQFFTKLWLFLIQKRRRELKHFRNFSPLKKHFHTPHLGGIYSWNKPKDLRCKCMAAKKTASKGGVNEILAFWGVWVVIPSLEQALVSHPHTSKEGTGTFFFVFLCFQDEKKT